MDENLDSECVAGYGHLQSLWLQFAEQRLIACFTDTPEGVEAVQVDNWLVPCVMVTKVPRKNVAPRDDVLPYLSKIAGARAVCAARDCNVYELALALTANYSWQLINGAKILPDYSELAKVYAGAHVIYLFKTQALRDAAAKVLA